MNKVFVTGAGGFVGKAVCDSLVGSHIVLGGVRNANVHSLPAWESVVCQLTPNWDWSEVLRGVSTVVHCAARVHMLKELASDPLRAYREVNLNGTLNLARQSAKAGVRRLVFVSSIKVNGEATKPGQAFRSQDVPMPLDPYGISKLEAEQGLREIELKTGLEVVIVRPTLVYGPNVRANFLRLLTLVSRGMPLPFGLVENRRSMVALDNLVNLLTTCITHPKAAGQTFMVSDGNDLSTPDLITLLAELMGCKARLLPVPPGILRLLGVVTRRRHDVERLLGSLQVNIDHTCTTLGWRPPINVETGLLKTVDWYLSGNPDR